MSLANGAGPNVVPVNQPVILQFNRFLNPATVTRQNIRLLTGSGGGFADAVVDYDPVLLQVTLSNPVGNTNWLVQGQVYEVNMPLAVSNNGGIQAIDNATLAAATKIEFTVGPAGAAYSEPIMHFCADVWPIFKGPGFTLPGIGIVGHGSCGSPNCHGKPQKVDISARFPTGESEPAEGLVLDTQAYVAQTAIGKVADESNVGAMAATGAAGIPFGIDMPIIDQGTGGTGDPANSWIMYKVLLAAPVPDTMDEGLIPPVRCAPFTTNESYQASTAAVITVAERLRLGSFILGREMPYPNPDDAGEPPEPDEAGGPGTDALSLRQMERLRLWIKQGAQFDEFTLPDGGKTQDCNSCINLTPGAPDAGGGEGGSTKDSASDAPSKG